VKISLLGPTNLKKFSELTGLSQKQIEDYAAELGKVIAKNKLQLMVFFNYSGMLKLVGDSYKRHGGKLEMIYTENDHDWETKCYMDDLAKADILTEKDSWHDMILHIVTEPDIVLCAGLSSGVFAELGYMKWNYQDRRGKVKALVGVKELLRGGEFPPELAYDMNKFMFVIPLSELDALVKTLIGGKGKLP
jgi:hypothetical protein